MGNFLIATAILWGLNTIFVQPLTQLMVRWKLNKPAYAHLLEMGPEGAQAEVRRLATRIFILVDVPVMFLAGALAGLAGYPLIGIARNAKAWPGMLTLIVASFYFASLAHV
jgi:hypothetical protein